MIKNYQSFAIGFLLLVFIVTGLANHGPIFFTLTVVFCVLNLILTFWRSDES